jgi:adenosylhomocysteine nucleosidase
MSQRPIVILTALDLEYDAVRARLSGLRSHAHPRGTRFEVGRLGGGCQVALALVGKGNQAAAVLAERAISEFKPAALLFVGVAGARQPHIALGDIVVATHIYAYHGGTSEDDGFKGRPRVWEAAHAADQIARHVVREGSWARGLARGGRTPHVHFGPIAAGEVVLNSRDSAHARWINEHYNDARAIEMEGAGIAQAGHLNNVSVVVIRGISDRADGEKEKTDGEQWQPRAAANAAAFAAALAAELATDAATGEGPAKTETRSRDMSGNRNIARDQARVGMQIGTVYGGVRSGHDVESPADRVARPAPPGASGGPPRRRHVRRGGGGAHRGRRGLAGEHLTGPEQADAGPEEGPRAPRRRRRAGRRGGERHRTGPEHVMTERSEGIGKHSTLVMRPTKEVS